MSGALTNAGFVRSCVAPSAGEGRGLADARRTDGRGIREPREVKVTCEQSHHEDHEDHGIGRGSGSRGGGFFAVGNGLVSAGDDARWCAESWTEACLGRTRVMAFVAAKVEEPQGDRSHEGQMLVNVDASSVQEAVAPEEALELGRAMEVLLRHSRAVDLESLCIIPARKAWAIRVDLRVQECDGNLLDTCAMAAIAALKTFRRPQHRVVEKTTPSVCGDSEGASTIQSVEVVPLYEKEGVRLTLHHMPFCVTFAVFRNRSKDGLAPDFVSLIDPTAEEEALADAKVIVGSDEDGFVRFVRKPGGALSLPKEDLVLLARFACLRARDLAEDIQRVVEATEVKNKQSRIKRKKGMTMNRNKTGAGAGAVAAASTKAVIQGENKKSPPSQYNRKLRLLEVNPGAKVR